MEKFTDNETRNEEQAPGRNVIELLSLLLIIFFLTGMFLKFLFF
jgi:hypothetical protein